MGETRGTYRILVGRAEGKRPLGRRRRRGEDNVTMGVKELGFEDWTGLIWLMLGTSDGLS
jgi:hypothetical protein